MAWSISSIQAPTTISDEALSSSVRSSVKISNRFCALFFFPNCAGYPGKRVQQKKKEGEGVVRSGGLGRRETQRGAHTQRTIFLMVLRPVLAISAVLTSLISDEARKEMKPSSFFISSPAYHETYSRRFRMRRRRMKKEEKITSCFRHRERKHNSQEIQQQ